MKTIEPCYCGNDLKCCDRESTSETWQCIGCQLCFLIIAPKGRRIALVHFSPERDDPWPRDDRAIVRRLIDDLVNDRWPPLPIGRNFGIGDSSHFGALQYAVRQGVIGSVPI